MTCEWLYGKWSWPPMESDPAVFQTLACELLGSGDREGLCGGEAAGSPLRDLLVTSTSGIVPPSIEEVLSCEQEALEALGNARALLVCFHNEPRVRGGPAPAVAAARAVAAKDVNHETFLVRQVLGLDAACGIIGLVHALLNADGLLPAGDSILCPQLQDGPLARWLDALPHNAAPEQRGRALLADRGIHSVYRVQAARGQSQMPASPLWAMLQGSSRIWTGLLVICLALWAVSVALLWSKKGLWMAVTYLGASLLWLWLWHHCCECRMCSGRGPRLSCHFVCLAAKGGRVLLLDGLQASVKDVGSCGENNAAFTPSALAFVRDALLPALSQPHTCSIMALKPSNFS